MKRLIGIVIGALIAAPALAADKVSAFKLGDEIEVTIVEAPFAELRAKVEGCSTKTEICRINGLPPFGVDLNRPKTYVKRIVIAYKGRRFLLETSNMYDAWGDRSPEGHFAGRCWADSNCEFSGSFSDGAGSFVASWSVVHGRTVRTVLSADEALMNFIDEQISSGRESEH